MTDTNDPAANGDARDPASSGAPSSSASANEATTSPVPDAGQVGRAVPATAEPASAETEVAAAAPAGDFAQHYTLLFCCTSMFVAAIWLPIEGRHLDLFAKDSIAGGFLAAFAAYGVLSKWMNIHSNKMIVWPAFFAAADGIYLCTFRAMQLVQQVKDPDTMDFRGWVHLFGPGYYVIAVSSLLVIWTLITAVMSGAKKEAARKEAAKAARGGKR